MDSETRNIIIEELTKYLNRAPTEQEIMNSQTDINISSKVKDRKDETRIAKMEADMLSNKSEVDLLKLNKGV